MPYLIYGKTSPITNDIGLKSATAVLLFFVLLVLVVRAVPRPRQAGALWRLTRSRGGWRKVGRYALLVVVAVIVLFPIYATLMQALKTGPDVLDHPLAARST